MRPVQLAKRQLLVAFEQFEPRAMLAARSLAIAPLGLGGGSTNLAAAVSTAKVTPTVHASAAKTAAAIAKPAVVTQLAGDFNHNGQLDVGDLFIFERALANLTAYQNANQLTDAQLLALADVNHDGVIDNGDLQALLVLIIAQENQPPPPPPPAKIVPPITPTVSSPASAVIVNTSTVTGPPVTSQIVFSGSSGAFVPLKSAEALLAGGGGDASPNAPTVSNNGPPMPTKTKTSDIALIAFAPAQSSGGDQVLEGMLMKLADVDEPQLLAIEYGDEVVKKEVTVNKKVIPPAPVEQPVVAPEKKVPVPVAEAVPGISGDNYWWLLSVPAGAGVAAGAWWMYRQREPRMTTLLRRLGLYRQ
jgi:hypothetical protein